MKKYIVFFTICLAIIVIYISYNKKSGEVLGEHVTVGVIAPFSKDAAIAGETIRKSIELRDYAHLTVIYEDDECDNKKAVSAYQKLRFEGVRVFYIGCSGSVLAVAPLAKKNGDLVLTAYAGSDLIRITGDEVIRYIPDGLSIVDSMSSYFEAIDTSKVVIVYENKDYSVSFANALDTKLKTKISREPYISGETDLRTVALKLKAKGYTHVIVIPYGEDSYKNLLKYMKEQNYSPTIIGETNTCDYLKGVLSLGFRVTCWQATLPQGAAATFAKNYTARYKEDPAFPFYQAATTDTFVTLNEIVKQLETKATIAKIKEKILSGVTGPYGTYTFTKDGEVSNSTDHLKRIDSN